MTTRGVVQGLLPVVPVSIIDNEGVVRQFRAGLDTGFNDFLSLPHSAIRQLGLRAAGFQVVTLANGESDRRPVYNAVIIWNEERISLPVLGLGAEPLVGMALLRGSRVTMDVAEGGAVVIEPL